MQNNEALSKQLEEKRMAKIAEKEQQDIIAKQYQNEVNKILQQDMDQKSKTKEQQANYLKDLNNQLKEKQKKKQYSVLMSEFERSVNDGDIKAYQNMDTGSLNSKIPGFNSYNPQEKYIDKSMNLTPQKLSSKSPDCLCKPSKSVDGAGNKSSITLRNRKLQNAAISSFENFGDGKGLKITLHEDNINKNKLERVRQNMEREDAIKYRANTNNRGYGFEQILKKSGAPSGAIITDDSPYEYNFKAPGNY